MSQVAKSIVLVWKPNEFGELIARVPARDFNGLDGEYVIHAVPRPPYCDRGKWHVLVEAYRVQPLDDQEGFPRYYFLLQNLQEEMFLWANEREACKEAAKREAGK